MANGAPAKPQLRLIDGLFQVAKLPPGSAVPPEPCGARLWSATRTDGELSVVCDDAAPIPGAESEHGWNALAVAGPLDFSLVGILAGIAGALASAGVSVFAISTFDTDYLLVKRGSLDDAVRALRAAGYSVEA